MGQKALWCSSPDVHLVCLSSSAPSIGSQSTPQPGIRPRASAPPHRVPFSPPSSLSSARDARMDPRAGGAGGVGRVGWRGQGSLGAGGGGVAYEGAAPCLCCCCCSSCLPPPGQQGHSQLPPHHTGRRLPGAGARLPVALERRDVVVLARVGSVGVRVE